MPQIILPYKMSLLRIENSKQVSDNIMFRTLLSEFNRSLMLIADKDLLVANTISKIRQITSVSRIIFYMFQSDTDQFRHMKSQSDENSRSVPAIFTHHSRLVNWLSINEMHLAVSQSREIMEYFSDKEREMIRDNGIELIYPLKVMNRMSGFVFLGKKDNGEAFTEQDINLLALLFDQAAFAIENTTLYEEQGARIKKMYRADRLAILGQLAAGAAHEIRNPLTAIRSTIQYLSKGMKNDPDSLEMVNELMEEVDRINKIIQGLLSFSKSSELETAKVDIEQLLRQSLILLNNTIAKEQVSVDFEIKTKNTVLVADASQLKQVFLNIILNAVEAMNDCNEKHLTFTIEGSRQLDFSSRYLVISFTDTGKGIEQENIENIFNPFYTTRQDGTGLGLPISFGIVNRHGGEMEANSIPGKGTSIVVKLPQTV